MILCGDRYGWIPLPNTIKKDEFEEILKISDEKELLKTWYKIDENQIPTSYVLQKRDATYGEYEKWNEVEKRLINSLKSASLELNLDLKDSFKSATQKEFLECIKEKDHIIAAVREISNKDDFFDTKFVDKDQIQVDDFKNKLKKSVPNFLKYSAKLLNEDEINFDKKEFIDKIYTALKEKVDEFLNSNSTNDYNQEQGLQNSYKNQKLSCFVGRAKTIDEISSYIEDKNTNLPLLIHAKSGMGKSSLMAKVISKYENVLEFNVIFRFVGASAKSFSLRELFISIVDEFLLKRLINKELLEDIDENLKNSIITQDDGVFKIEYSQKDHEFYKQIREILSLNFKSKIVLFIDAPDQLKDKDKFISVIPKNISSNLKLIITTLNDEKYQKDSKIFHALKDRVKTINLEDDKFKQDEKEDLIKQKLEIYNKKLSDKQLIYVMNQWQKAGFSPLYITIATQELKEWKSSDKTYSLEDSTYGLVKEWILNLSKFYHHSQSLVKKTLCYISFSKYGISESEMLELLSSELAKDEVFRSEILNSYHNPIKNNDKILLPASVWVRFYEAIKTFLVMVDEKNEVLIQFFHREFKTAMLDFYNDEKAITHEKLAKYFDLKQDGLKFWDDKFYNSHAVSEVCYHLRNSNQISKLNSYLKDLEFIGSTYDWEKQNDYLDELNLKVGEECAIYQGFFREKFHLITKNYAKSYKPHIGLFTLAYEDGKNSPLHKDALNLLSQNRVNFNWLKKEIISDKFSRSGLMGVFSFDEKIKNILELKNKDIAVIFNKSAKIYRDFKEICSFEFDGYFKEIKELSNGDIIIESEIGETLYEEVVLDKTIIEIYKDYEKIHSLDFKNAIVDIVELSNGNILLKEENIKIYHDGYILKKTSINFYKDYILCNNIDFSKKVIDIKELSNGDILFSFYNNLNIYQDNGTLIKDFNLNCEIKDLKVLSNNDIAILTKNYIEFYKNYEKSGDFEVEDDVLEIQELSNGDILSKSKDNIKIYNDKQLLKDFNLNCEIKDLKVLSNNDIIVLTKDFLKIYRSYKNITNLDGKIDKVFECKNGDILVKYDISLKILNKYNELVLHIKQCDGFVELDDEKILSWSESKFRVWDRELFIEDIRPAIDVSKIQLDDKNLSIKKLKDGRLVVKNEILGDTFYLGEQVVDKTFIKIYKSDNEFGIFEFDGKVLDIKELNNGDFVIINETFLNFYKENKKTHILEFDDYAVDIKELSDDIIAIICRGDIYFYKNYIEVNHLKFNDSFVDLKELADGHILIQSEKSYLENAYDNIAFFESTVEIYKDYNKIYDFKFNGKISDILELSSGDILVKNEIENFNTNKTLIGIYRKDKEITALNLKAKY